jgi:hypothetical protein
METALMGLIWQILQLLQQILQLLQQLLANMPNRFWAAHLMATHSDGMSAVQLEAQPGIAPV